MSPTRQRELTGRHVLFIMLAFFGVIIAVNLTNAFLASRSWTGTVAENTHVASRQFNAKTAEARAQAALGWTARLSIADGKISYQLIDAAGKPVPAKAATVNLRRPTHVSEDQSLTLTLQPDGALSAPANLRDGLWTVEILTEAGLERPYRDARRLTLRNGASQ